MLLHERRIRASRDGIVGMVALRDAQKLPTHTSGCVCVTTIAVPTPFVTADAALSSFAVVPPTIAPMTPAPTPITRAAGRRMMSARLRRTKKIKMIKMRARERTSSMMRMTRRMTSARLRTTRRIKMISR